MEDLLVPVLLVLVSFCVGAGIATVLIPMRRKVEISSGSSYLRWAEYASWVVLIVLLCCEFVYCGYVPLLAKLQGAGISHFEFGIPSVHGVVLAGIAFLCTIRIVESLLECRVRHAVFWLGVGVLLGIVLMSRKLFMVLGLQALVLVVYFYPPRYVIPLCLLGFAALFSLFGLAGEMRSGGAMEIVSGIPKGSLLSKSPALTWVYMYAATPLHNLSYAMENYPPERNLIPRRSINTLLPTAFREAVGVESRANRFKLSGNERYWLESKTFNVSTAFIGPYLDWGHTGVAAFAFLIGFLSSVSYAFYGSLPGLCFVSILSTGCLLSVYSDSFTNLNFVGQFVWLAAVYVLASGVKRLSQNSRGVQSRAVLFQPEDLQ
ncbi:hypothetical protein [Crateriforma spongiae]|uniref:hypothetical protein n=1 Tax=Crateriforma spongiae TaxID=2724528 RepID=UPI00197FC31B|nr:hypothetical protein [Crateriforma spongiae]